MKCSKCPNTSTVGYKLCEECRIYFRTKTRGYRSNGNSYQMKDKQSRLVRLNKRVREGICSSCSSDKLDNSPYCLYHFVYNAARAYKIKDKLAIDKLVDRLVKQDFKCFYTNAPIVPGINCSVEHVIPRSNGHDATDTENIVWIDLRVNRMKGSIPLEQFIDICSQIATNSSNILKRVEKGNDVK